MVMAMCWGMGFTTENWDSDTGLDFLTIYLEQMDMSPPQSRIPYFFLHFFDFSQLYLCKNL